MNNSKITFGLLLLILIMGGILRFYRLAEVPVAFNGDEAGFGYNAYAIFKMLKDEHGQYLPWVFKSFGDYKPPIFVYMLAPLTGMFGLNELVVRAPIAAVSTLLILLTFIISRKMFRSNTAALLAALMVAMSPWAINFSRAGWEASLALFFTTLAVALFLTNFKRGWVMMSLVMFMIAFYTYHSEKVAVPLIIGSLVLIFRHKLVFSLKQKTVLGLLLLGLALPAIIGFTNISGQSRAKGSLVTDYLFYPTKDSVYELTADTVSEPGGLVKRGLLHSNMALAFTDISAKIYAYLSPANLFVDGDEVGRHGVEDFGMLYKIDFFFLVITVYFLITKPKTRYMKFLIIWLVIGLLPAMITKDKLHSIRPLLALPPLYILEAWGVIQLLQEIKVRSKRLLIPVILAAGLIMGIEAVRYYQSYFIYTPIERADWWQYGYKQAVLAVMAEQDRFDRVVIDVPAIYGNPYIFFLFYQMYDPNLYNMTARREDVPAKKVTAVFGFGKYEFRKIFWPIDRGLPKTLFVGTNMALPRQDVIDPLNFKLIKEISMPDGETVFRVVETFDR